MVPLIALMQFIQLPQHCIQTGVRPGTGLRTEPMNQQAVIPHLRSQLRKLPLDLIVR